MSNDEISARVLELAIAIQQIPAPTFSEFERAEWVSKKFQAEGLADVFMDELGNVYARLPGRSDPKPIVVTAHLDTVFPKGSDLQIRRSDGQVTGAGLGDNALGVAGLFGLRWLLKTRQRLQRDLWLVANVGEEGLGDLRGMRGVVERFKDLPVAYLVLEGMALGTIYHRGLRVRRFRISVRAPGGHSWVDFGRPSAVHELTRLADRILTIPVPTSPRTTYNIGVIQGGTSVNTIAAQAMLELDLRSEDEAALEGLAREVHSKVEAANQAGAPEVQFTITQIGDRPGGELPRRHPLAIIAARALERQGLTPRFEIGSTDANLPLSYGYPAICIGLTNGRGAHTLEETIETAPLRLGLAQLLEIVLNLDRMRG